MPNQDNGELQTAGGSIAAEQLKQLKIITLLLRQGLNIPESDDASLSSQTLPTILVSPTTNP